MAVDIDLLNSNSRENITENFERVKEALQDTIGRSGTLPNQMNSDLDMNDADILNVSTLETTTLLVNGERIVLKEVIGYTPVDGSVTEPKLASSLKRELIRNVETRTALATTDTNNYKLVNLMESGREGLFYWNSGNLSSQVSNDSLQGIYVAPSSDTTGASGAWVRLHDNKVYPSWWGALGNGVNDDTAAINAALSQSNRHVVFKAGTYQKNIRTVLKPNTHITLEQGATIRRYGSDGYLFVNGDGTGSGGYTGCSDILIDGLGEIDLNSSGPTTTAAFVMAHHDGLTIRDITIRNGFESHYIEINSSRNVLIENVKFPDHASAGSGNYETIQIDYSNEAGFPAFGPYDNTPCKDVIIRGCYFGAGQTAIGNHSFPSGSLHENIQVLNNSIESQTSFGIRAHGWKNSKIVGNNIRNAGIRGIFTWASLGLDITNNHIDSGCTDYGIQVSWDGVNDPVRNVISNNHLIGLSGLGIYISNGFDHNVFGNDIVNVGQGAISITQNVAWADVRINHIAGASKTTDATYSAIRCDGSNCSIQTNTIRSTSGNSYTYAIYLASNSSNCLVSDNKIQAGTSGTIGNVGTGNVT